MSPASVWDHNFVKIMVFTVTCTIPMMINASTLEHSSGRTVR
nr:MAG TPA: hypothetical protein [Caudoviricetes sp.]